MTIVSQKSGRFNLPKRSLAQTHPGLAAQWSPENTMSIHDITPGSARKVLWICPEDSSHVRTLEVYRMVRGIKCPECFQNNRAIDPEIAAQWSPDNDRLSTEVTRGSSYKAEWVCSEGHQWIAGVHSRTAGRGCPECSRSVRYLPIPGLDDLATTHPDIAAEWSPENTRAVSTVSYGSDVYEATWECRDVPEHIWTATPWARTRGTGACPRCGNRKTSTTESHLRAAVSTSMALLTESATGCRWSNGVPMTADIIGTTGSGKRIVIEYDGSYWHEDTAERDILKTRTLLDAGYIVVRVREQSRYHALPFLSLEHENLYQTAHDLEYGVDVQNFGTVSEFIGTL